MRHRGEEGCLDPRRRKCSIARRLELGDQLLDHRVVVDDEGEHFLSVEHPLFVVVSHIKARAIGALSFGIPRKHPKARRIIKLEARDQSLNRHAHQLARRETKHL